MYLNNYLEYFHFIQSICTLNEIFKTQSGLGSIRFDAHRCGNPSEKYSVVKPECKYETTETPMKQRADRGLDGTFPGRLYYGKCKG
jgi:hypothetical protein